MSKIDELQQQKMRDLLVKLLREYGVKADLDGFDNAALKAELEKVVSGVQLVAENDGDFPDYLP